jgi:GNAT superfamily N-acetyltransferase
MSRVIGPGVRRAKFADADTIADVQIETWQDTYAGLLPTGGLLRMSKAIDGARWRAMIANGDHVLVAEEAPAGIVGFGSCGPCRGGAPGFAGEIYTLYVRPGRQGEGTGRRLLEALFAELRGAGYESAMVWVLDRNPARFFYEAMGGRRIAERREKMWGTTVNEAAYGWTALAPLAGEGGPRRAR